MAYTRLTEEEKQARKEARKEAKKVKQETERVEAEKNQKKVKRMILTIEWKRSRAWGSNPHLTAQVEYHSGHRNTGTCTASGCGYCKESTVIAEAFNTFLKYKLHEIKPTDQKKSPYGIRFSEYRGFPNHYFEGGIGTNCYESISDFIGGEFRKITGTGTVDVFEYVDNSND